MKKILAITAILVLSTHAWGQSNLRPWEHGPLTWSDFSVVHESIGAEHSYLEFILDIENRMRDYDGIRIPVRTAVAYMDKNLSWVDSIHRTPQELHYNRVLFNMVELYRRFMQLELDTSGKANPNYYMRLLAYEADSFCRSTYYGSDTVAVAWWEYDIRRQLDSITPLMVAKHQETNQVTGYRPLGSLALSIGVGTKFFTGELYNYFAPCGGFYMDFDIGIKRHVFTGGFYVGGGGCKPDSIITVKEKNKLYHDDIITTIDLHVDYGFNILDHPLYTLTPFVGFGLQGMYYDDDEISNGPSEGCWRVGVDFKYDFGQENAADATSLSQFGIALHGKVYVSFDRFRSIVGSPQGQTINAQVGFSFRAREKEILRPAQQSR